MKIEYFGHSCFRLTTGTGLTVLTDPYTQIGYELPRGLSADIVLCSHRHFDHCYTQGVQAGRVISAVGEYIFDGLKITGYPCYHDEVKGAKRGDNIIFVLEADGLKLCHMGDFGETSAEAYREPLSGADLLFLPVGGVYTVDAKTAKKIVDTLQPKRVIPMHYKTEELAIDIADETEFLSFYAAEDREIVSSGVWEYNNAARKIIRMERKRS